MRFMMTVLASMLLLSFAGVSQAKDKANKPANKGDKLVGQVVSVDGNTLKIKKGGKNGEETSVTTDANTVIMVGGAAAKLSDLKPGQRVVVTPTTGTAQKINARNADAGEKAGKGKGKKNKAAPVEPAPAK